VPIAYLDNIDLNWIELLRLRLQNLATHPATPQPGWIYYNTTDNVVYVRAASTWVDLFAGLSGYTDEQAQDAIGAAFAAGTRTGITITYNDAANRFDFAVTDSPLLGGQNGAHYLARANHTGTQSVSTLSDHNKTVHDALGIDAATVGGATAAQLRDRATHTGTQAITVSTLSAAARLVGRVTAGAGAAEELTAAQAKTLLAIVPADVAGFDTQVRTSRLDQMAIPTADLNLNTRKITGLADGTVATDAVTLGQLTGAVQGQTWKDPVRAATTANITLSGTQTIDGIALVANDRVLVKNQTAGAANGIYLVQAGAWTRTVDMDTAAEANNATVLVRQGTVNSGDVFTQTANIVTLGTTVQTWVQSGEGNTLYGADGTTIILTGTTFSVGTVPIIANTSGTLTVARGGTGQTTLTNNGVLLGAGTGNVAAVTGTANQVLRVPGGGGAPAFGAIDLAQAAAITGTLALANGGTGATTAAAARTSLGAVGKAVGSLTGGATSEVLTHNLNTRDVIVTIRNHNSPWEEVMVANEATTVNTVTIRAASALPAGYRWTVTG
jgi:hypothetical protein